jgi:uncharacterized protein (DUF983 family)
MSKRDALHARFAAPGAHAKAPAGALAGLLRRLWGLVWGIVAQRCPRCRRGRMFRGPVAMNDPCPECGLIFQREEGSFLGAMYFSYLLASAILVPFYFAAAWLLPEWNSLWVAVVAVLGYVPFIPAVFRYSRVLWVYAEYAVSGDDSAGLYEKLRQSQLAQRKASPGNGKREEP